MRIELAPMEGITTYIYRNAIAKYYGGVETYFSPFISTHKDKELNFKEKKDIKPENNSRITLVPQVLTGNAEEFLYTSGQISKYGYDHININLGCPSGTVTTKNKGAGALVDISRLEQLLDDIFSKTDLKISIKTRMGYTKPEEFEKLMEIYDKYPLEELIIHARVREDFYKGTARIKELAEIIKTGKEQRKYRVSYNGDVYSLKDYISFKEILPDFDTVMLGRGIIARPWLAKEIDNGSEIELDIETFKAFNHELIEGYDAIMPGEKNTLFKLKELWIYMIKSFESQDYDVLGYGTNRPSFGEIPENGEAKKLLKSIRKCNSLREYELIIDRL